MNARIPASGTVYTPGELADAMVRALGDEKQAAWLDPCVGEGAFVRAMAATGVPRSRIVAVDLERTCSVTDRLADTVRGADFISWSQGTPARFDRIVANPPYVALSRLDQPLLRAALAMRSAAGSSIRPKANYWCAFLLGGLRLLAPGGSMCMVLPAAWDYADYAASFRSAMPLQFRRFEVFRAGEPLFGSVQDGCVVIVGRDFGGQPSMSERFELASTADLVSALKKSGRAAKSSGKVIHLRSARAEPERATKPFTEAFELHIGAVTGDAGYFLLTENERIAHDLPVQALRRCVTRANHLRAAEATDGAWNQLRLSGARVWLFHPPDRMLDHPSIRKYCALPPSRGGCHRKRFKVASRDPWYRTPLPTRVEGFLSGMSRIGPWICLRRDERLTATNTLYTVRFRLADTWNDRAAWAISLLAPSVRQQLLTRGRRYPDGLLKYEPGDLQGLVVPVPPQTKGALRQYRAIVTALLADDRRTVNTLIAAWFGEEVSARAPAPIKLAAE